MEYLPAVHHHHPPSYGQGVEEEERGKVARNSDRVRRPAKKDEEGTRMRQGRRDVRRTRGRR